MHPWVNKSLERAQAKVEAFYFDNRRNILKFDDVANEQRKVIFAQRMDLMSKESCKEIIDDMLDELVSEMVDGFMPENVYPDQWDLEGLSDECKRIFNNDWGVKTKAQQENENNETIKDYLKEKASSELAQRAVNIGIEDFRAFEKNLVLDTIDIKWREHILRMEHLRSVIGFRGYANRDPLVEFKTEAFELFVGLLNSLRMDVIFRLFNERPMTLEEHKALIEQLVKQHKEQEIQAYKEQAKKQGKEVKLGRNDPCFCGSGKKFKHCHGRQA